ncbi:MAG: hypothetical protein KZQ99_22435 [Candidatus Thiodiazotropha sp. (ex Dulcina madagascariensis)]|nr:hypothetical protein [Candidatus Thiodiazotropha sp. (ex Dulcina madagascariensis)]
MKINQALLRSIVLGGALFQSTQALAAWGDSYISNIVGPSRIEIRTCAKFAGAICSLKWYGKEFVDTYDHGRELQSAAQFYFAPDDGVDKGETYNPTEAGTKADGGGPTSSSVLQGLSAIGNVLQTQTQMAFYLAPGEFNQRGYPVVNTTVLSNYVLNKKITIGLPGIAHAIEYRTQFNIPTNEEPVRGTFETVAAYLPSEFSRFYTYDVEGTKKLLEHSGEIGNGQNLPVIISTPNQIHAMGIYTPSSKQAFQRRAIQNARRFINVNKFNSVFRINDLPNSDNPDKQFHFVSYVIVGSLNNVRMTMDQLKHRFY